ncbi:uncharacterized protein P884DRAFT_86376 [Thermothelomyces heterothallicus CBS 202.75]|uniref:uncharacterized protein n=1 Tax=Thermothelomyces heterothallicus CBS 202.75 TaxID=1149848 RepID=UPI003742717B
MWDRFKIVPQNAGRQIDHPLDDDRIRVGLGIGYGGQNAPKGYSYSIKGGPAPPRPPREFFESQYETVPAVKEPPRCSPNRIAARAANLRPTSSVYSQDSLSLPYVPSYAANYTATVATKYSYRYGGADEISPPSSPEADARHVDRFLPGDVSPIDEDDGPEYHHTAGIPPGTGAPINDRSAWSYAPDPRPAPQSPPRNRGTASIPAMRRERRRQSDAATRDSRANQPGATPQQTRNPPPAREAPRWDPLTGEQTNSARGRPAQVKPAEYAQGPGIPPQAWTEPRKSPTAPPPSFTDRVKRIAKKAAAAREGSTEPAAGAFTSSRPGWRGASGRTAIVDPVYDNPNVPPLQIPEKSSKRNVAVATGPKSNLTPEGPVRRDQTPPVSSPASETPTRSAAREAIRRILPSAHSPAATQTQHQTGQGYPSPPLPENSARDDTPAVAAARELVRDGHYGAPAHPNPPLQSPDSSNQFRRKPPPPVQTNPQHQHQVSVSSVYSQQTNAPHPSPLPLPDDPHPAENTEEPYVPPPSRFSITTYATSNTGTTRDDADEHPDEDQPPVPSLPADYQQQQHADGDRPSFDHNSPATSPPQPIPRSHPSATVAPNPAVARALAQDRPSSRASDINKTLPPAPPEQSADQAQDRVGLLNAQLRSLANRRININRSIQQMTQLMPTDKLMNSAEVVRKREIEKQKVDALRQELADVQREEYELGLKLHRAYKRLDREAEWEPTTLWVRRVTG